MCSKKKMLFLLFAQEKEEEEEEGEVYTSKSDTSVQSSSAQFESTQPWLRVVRQTKRALH